MAQRLYRQGGPEEGHRVFVMHEDAADVLPKADLERLQGLDGLCGGTADAPGEYVPVREEHAAELKAQADAWQD